MCMINSVFYHDFYRRGQYILCSQNIVGQCRKNKRQVIKLAYRKGLANFLGHYPSEIKLSGPEIYVSNCAHCIGRTL